MSTRQKATSGIKTSIIMSVLVTITSWANAQGSLTPSGAPSATMKTLQQVEPRTPISSGPYTITQPGSYYLTTNITQTIFIHADNVTLDLMGFRIAVSSGNAITIPNGYGTNTRIHNGTLRPENAWIALDARYADDCIFENLRIEGNNAFCGIMADERCLVRNCEVRGCNNRGISVGIKTEVRDCHVIGGTLDGIHAHSNCRIIGNTIEDNGDDGLYITGSKTYITDNIIKGNVDNYDIAASNQLNILLCEVPETLDWPCSVKFAGTLICTINGANGITVYSDDVTVDLAVVQGYPVGTVSTKAVHTATLQLKTARFFIGKALTKQVLKLAGTQASFHIFRLPPTITVFTQELTI